MVLRPFDHGGLHAQAEAKEGNALFPCPANRRDLALDPAVSESTWNHNGIHALQQGVGTFCFDLFRADPMHIQGGVLGDACVPERFDNGEVGIVQLDVLAYQRNLHRWSWVAQVVHQLLPGRHVAVVVREIKDVENFAAEALLFESQRHGINAVGIERRDHSPFLHTTESADFALHLVADRSIASAHQHIRLDSDRAQLFHRVLGGLCFQLS